MKNILLHILVILTFFSCEKELPSELPPFEHKLVVNSVIRPDTAISVFLTENLSVLSYENPTPVTNAVINLFEDNVLIGQLGDTILTGENLIHVPNYAPMDDLRGFYYLDYVPKENSTYRLEIDHPDFPSAKASTIIPKQTANYEVTLSEPKVTVNGENSSGELLSGRAEYTATIKINDPIESNYYGLAVLEEAPSQVYEYDENGEFIGSYYSYPFLYEIDFTSDDILFDVIDNPLYTEDKNPGLGDNGKVFSDELFDGQQYTLQITFEVTVGAWAYSSIGDEVEIEVAAERFFIELRSLSKDYYQYKHTVALQDAVSSDPFAEPVQIYNNIENGYGIFGGYNVALFEFSLEEFIPSE